MHHQDLSQLETRKSGVGRVSAARGLLICILLALATLALYWPARQYEFVNYDDLDGIAKDPGIRGGLSWRSVAWAFQNRHMGNWQPLTSLSHMLDCQLFGLKAGSHHLVSVSFHAANTVLLFLVLGRLTGSRWRSAFVAGLFAFHPLHVESVAWVSERKDVLSTFFFILTLRAYASFAREKATGRVKSGGRNPKAEVNQNSETRNPVVWYVVALFLFACGLMSKPMLVTLPFVLLLLDYWPLRRLKLNTCWPLLWEKLPFFALALVASGITVVTQSRSHAVVALSDWPLSDRIANALVSYIRYLGKMLWPQGLVAYCPRVSDWPAWQVVVAALLLGAITVALVRRGRRWPYLAVGWLWFLGTLVPVIGLVQVGNQALADRYTYIPLMGLFILVTWGIADLWAKWRLSNAALSALGLVVLGTCMVRTRTQVGYWRDSITLFKHELAVIPNVALANNNIGAALYDRGRYDEAVTFLREALRLKPQYVDAHNNLGLCLWHRGHEEQAIAEFQAILNQGPDAKAFYNLGVVLFNEGKLDQARDCFVAALRLQPDSAEAQNNLGNVLASQGRFEEAGGQFAAAVRSAPDFVEARCNLAQFFVAKGAPEQAVDCYVAALRVRPECVEAHHGLAKVLEQTGRLREAAEHYAAAVHLQPAFAEAHNNLSNLAAKLNDPESALTHALAAVQLKPDWAEAHYNLGNALFLQGELGDAVAQYSEALLRKTNYFEAHQNLGFALEKLGWYKEATVHYGEVVRMRPDFAAAYNRLAVVLARQARFDEAVKAAETGIALAVSSGQDGLAEELRNAVQNYRAGRVGPLEKKQL